MRNVSFRNYADILTACQTIGKFTVSVAVAEDEDVLQAVKMTEEIGLADAVLVGDEVKILPLIKQLGLERSEIVHEPDHLKAVRKAVSLVKGGQADFLMKGLVNTSDFMRAVLDSKDGLKTGSLLSHLAAFEIPGERKLIFMTDGGLNISPDLTEKKAILLNSLEALEKLGVDNPKIAVLAANEKVNPKMQSTVDAKALVEMRATGEIASGVIEGPIALDVATSHKAAQHKGIESKISGNVDLYLVPSIEAGNLFAKILMYYANAKMAGLVLGALCPIVLTSRAETAEGKLNSLALACLMTRSHSLTLSNFNNYLNSDYRGADWDYRGSSLYSRFLTHG